MSHGENKTPHVLHEQPESQHTLIHHQGRRNAASPKPRASEVPTLRYRHRALWILAFYVPLLVVPWALTCVLTYHPVGLPSYVQTVFTQSNLSTQRRVVDVLAVLNSVVSIVTIPLISALLAQAAVVFTQRRGKTQSVSVRQTFALADAGWSNPSILLESWPPWKTHAAGNATQSGWSGSGSGFLWLAALFLLLCSVQQPIREGFVSTERVLVMTTGDNPAASDTLFGKARRYMSLGYDAEPADIAMIPEGVVVQQLEKSLASLSMAEVPTHLWPDLQNPSPFELSNAPYLKQLGPWARPDTGFFVAALPNGTTTGVLRQRAMRLNSTVRCTMIEKSVFPSICEGQAPFTASFRNESAQFGVRICVPGQRGKFPWRLSRSRQDAVEDIFVDVDTVDEKEAPVSYTQHCSVKTTRGYFELGNYRNNNVPGALLDEWIEPDPFAKNAKFNDYLSELWRDANILDIARNGTATLVGAGGRWRRPSDEDKPSDIRG
ncbi:hypothetical protein ACJQWK_07108 [Exserohilum turcicum]|uniref:Uncharacterized protein n=1 Tax=Exserohilum turcicum (strain 28A) TaxID=671987 RepID=R0K958_EXST2|nr:uncharacterized protein SETTUDRAFT_136898 [Exserohilum turcica Et28A]EOA84807.1 hypothetical protein SETTUDRAFT_136898 [Exserohilum turcica Et28A]